jgi:vacuolar-type H+-ATPase subunit E/Vma4
VLEVEGIERIKNHILAEADRTVRSIEEESRQLVEKETLECERECQRILAEAKGRADHDADLLVKRGESIADAERRKRDLAVKQEIVDEVITRALDKLLQEPPEKRVARYADWIHALNIGEGVITLSANEKTALGGALLKALPGGRFSIAEEEGDFTGGLMVAHGRVQDNLTYDLAVRDHRPELARLAFDKLG